MTNLKIDILKTHENRLTIKTNYSEYIIIDSPEKNLSSIYMELPEQAGVKVKSFSGANRVKNAINYLLKDQFII